MARGSAGGSPPGPKCPHSLPPRKQLFWHNDIYNPTPRHPLPLQWLGADGGSTGALPPGLPPGPRFPRFPRPLGPAPAQAPPPPLPWPLGSPGRASSLRRQMAQPQRREKYQGRDINTSAARGAERTGQTKGASEAGRPETPKCRPGALRPAEAAGAPAAATAAFLRVHLLRRMKSPGGEHSRHKADLRGGVIH